MFRKNPLKKYGMGKKDFDQNYNIFHTLQFGETDEMFREAKRLNRVARKLKDRKYFVWPVAGPVDHAILVVGRKADTRLTY